MQTIKLVVSYEMAKKIKECGLAEIAIRGEYARFKDIVKVAVAIEQHSDKPEEIINSLMRTAQQMLGISEKDASQIKKNVKQVARFVGDGNLQIDSRQLGGLVNEGMKFLFSNGDLGKMVPYLNVGLAAANLCMTAAAFALISEKINQISAEMKDIKKELNGIAENQEIAWIEKYEDVISDYSHMLDRKKIKDEFTSEEYYELAKKMNLTMQSLIQVFMRDACTDPAEILNALYALMPMLANLLCEYDRKYYFSNKDQITSGSRFHNEHPKWMQTLNTMYSQDFLDKLQDYLFINLNMSSADTNEAVTVSFMHAAYAITRVNDEDAILLKCDSMDDYNKIQNYIDQKAKEKAIESIEHSDHDEEISTEELKVILSKAEQMLATAQV